jgi:hypothetical protein
MIALSSKGGHSAQVNMRLLVNGSSLSIAQMGPDFLLVDAPIDHPPGNASVVMQVDQSESRWQVNLPEGISTTSKKILITTCA